MNIAGARVCTERAIILNQTQCGRVKDGSCCPIYVEAVTSQCSPHLNLATSLFNVQFCARQTVWFLVEFINRTFRNFSSGQLIKKKVFIERKSRMPDLNLRRKRIARTKARTKVTAGNNSAKWRRIWLRCYQPRLSFLPGASVAGSNLFLSKIFSASHPERLPSFSISSSFVLFFVFFSFSSRETKKG